MFNGTEPVDFPPRVYNIIKESQGESVTEIDSSVFSDNSYISSFSEQQTFTGTQNNYCYNYDTLRSSTGLKFLHLNVITLLPNIDKIKNFIIDLDLDYNFSK